MRRAEILAAGPDIESGMESGVEPDDSHWMARCLELAQQASEVGEVPVGAVVVRDNLIIGEAFNQPIRTADPSAHAEILALRAAAKSENNYRLPGATLYVSLEPCSMCAGALVHARIARLVYGAPEPRAGAIQSQSRLLDAEYLNHRVEHSGGCLAQQSAALIQRFFRSRR